jgi:uncharacterized protein (DUF1015 family)
MAKGNPNSFLHVNKAEIDFPPGHDPYGPDVYRRAGENLQRLAKDGIMIRDAEPCFYVYRLTWRGRSQTGFMALSSVEEYDAGRIKKHEHTRPEKVNDRANLIMSMKAQGGPVFVTFRANPEIRGILKKHTAVKAETDFVAHDGVRHEVWVISDKTQIAEIEAAFARLDAMYVADGHHRSQSASEVCRRMKEQNPNHTGKEIYNFFLNGVFPDEELRILPYNRVVKDLNGLTVKELLAKAGKWFDIGEASGAVEPEKTHVFGMYAEGRWYKLTSKAGSFDERDAVASIDAAILSKNFLDPILGIKDLRTDKRIDFVGGIRGVEELVKLVDSGAFKIAFSLPATTIQQLLRVADAGDVMPPKSTWFEPKLLCGLIVNMLKE